MCDRWNDEEENEFYVSIIYGIFVNVKIIVIFRVRIRGRAVIYLGFKNEFI